MTGNAPARILIVEDEALSAMMLEDRLAAAGFRIAGVAGTGEDALEIVRTGEVDIVLMDLHLAGEMDGVETAGRIKAGKDIPLIFMTGYSNDEVQDQIRVLNPLASLSKPVIVAEITSIIKDRFKR